MSKNILLAEIRTELEKIENLLTSRQLDDVRRSRIAGYGEELDDLRKQLEKGNIEEAESGQKLKIFREALKTI